MRLHLAEEPRKVNPPDIQEALNDWRAINSPDLHGDKRRWATFEALQFEHERVVTVRWGHILSGNFKERAIQTISYSLRKDGTIAVTRHTHS